ncbi:hypothetical protein D3C81_1885400 [compost metagenome]
MPGGGLNEPGPSSLVAQGLAKRSDALGQRLLGHRRAFPDLFQKAPLGDEPALFADQQDEGVQIPSRQFDSPPVLGEAAVVRIQHEAIEIVGVRHDFRISSSRAQDSHRRRPQGSSLTQGWNQGNDQDHQTDSK